MVAPHIEPNLKMSILSKEHIEREWHVIEKFFDKAIPYTLGRTTIEQIKKRIEDEFAMVVICWDPDPRDPVIYSAFLVEADEYPGKKVFHISMAGGEDIHVWGEFGWPAFKQMAKNMGFDQIEISGRPGWSKFITAKETHRNYVEEL